MCITQSLSLTCFKMDIRTAISNLSSSWVLIRGGAWVAWAPLFAGSGWPTPPPLPSFWRSGFATAHFVAQWLVCIIHTMSWMSHLWVKSQYFPLFDGFNTPCSFSLIRIFIMVLIIIGRVLYLQLAENKLISGMNTELSLWGASLGAWTPSIVSSLTP